MVVAEIMEKPILKVSVSDSESSSNESSEEADSEVETGEMETEGDVEDNNSALTDSSSDEDQQSDNEVLIANEGWADSVSKILGSSKPKNKKSLVLSRAKKYSEVQIKKTEEKPSFEVVGETKDEKHTIKTEDKVSTEPPAKKKKPDKPSLRIKPNILEKDRERLLNKIATKGVVQLFNAVRNQQKTMEKELNRSDIAETKKEKILKKFDKRTFLDTLMGQTKSVIVDEGKSLKNEVKDEDKPRWNALRDDFMMGAKMKDWDKDSEDE